MFLKLLSRLILGTIVSVSFADDAGHWGGGYVSAHPDAYHQHQGFLIQDSYARNWYRHPVRYERHSRIVKCKYVKPYRHAKAVRRCYYVR